MIVDLISLPLLIGMMAGLALTVLRLIRGPGIADRFVALDMFTAVAVAISALFALVTERREFMDIGLGLAVTGFVATVALASFLERKEKEE